MQNMFEEDTKTERILQKLSLCIILHNAFKNDQIWERF